MKTASPVRWHVLGWLVYASYELLGRFVEPSETPLRIALILNSSTLLLRLAEFYVCYRLVFPRLLRPGRGGALAGALLGVVAGYVALRYGIEEVLFPAVLGFRNYHNVSLGFYAFDNLYYASPAIVVAGAVWAVEAAVRRGAENQQLRHEKRQAETAFLKSQINPHFLYNTLNLLYGMAYPVSKPLAAAVLKLAELMRYMLHEGADGQVALSQEIDYLRNFLALYCLRFPDRFFVDFAVVGEPGGLRVAPLLLIPFVENACKHGVLDDAAHPVRVQLAIGDNELTFAVTNRVSDYQKDAGSGVGLPNLRRRLALLYPGRHTLHATAENGLFTTRLHLRPADAGPQPLPSRAPAHAAA